MNIIKKLDDITINQIAAGEILDRPSSAIKELIENSIDANATEIYIDLTNGGKSKISISDNGVGMSKEDLNICYIRHTTSKFIDFNEIKTFGFRGEALASIASVSHVIITSKQEESKYSNIIEIKNSKKIKESKGFEGTGTKIEIIDLFHNTPSRLNFLKSTNYELALIVKKIKQFAITSPHIHLVCSHNNKEIFSTFKDDNRIKLVLGEHFIENSMKINFVLNNIHIQGYASLPTYTKTNSDHKWIFINNRLIQDKIFHTAITRAYKDVITHGAHAILFLHISIPLNEVDINVHPQKKEAKFLNSNEVYKAIYQALTESIYQNGKRSINITNTSNLFPSIEENKVFYQPDKTLKENNQFLHSKINEESFINSVEESEISRKNFTTNRNELINETQKSFNLNNNHKISTEQNTLTQCSNDHESQIDLGYAIGQLNNKYIISCKKDTFIITDQHAGHERVLYEKLKKSFKKYEKQKLITPIKTSIVDISEHDLKRIYQFGFKLIKENAFYYITEHPVLLNNNFEEIIMAILDHQKRDINYLLANIACKNAMKSGMNMSINEMNSFLRLIEKSDKSGQCNHGRPSYIQMNIMTIDKLFQRT